MTDYVISISESLYEQARRLAEQQNVPVDEVIRERLADSLQQPLVGLPADEQSELQAMSYLSDDALWTIARERMQPTKQVRLSYLMEKNSQGTLSEDEHEELTRLVDDGDRLTLRKAQAMKLLLQRGYSVELNDLQPRDE